MKNDNNEFQFYVVYTDGSCIGNGTINARASWSYVVTDCNNVILEASTGKVEGKQDSNRAELIAFLKALQYVRNQPRYNQYVIRTDYEALCLYWQGMSIPKANKDLYRKIDYLANILHDRVRVEFIQSHTPHSSVPHFINNIVDKLARKCHEIFSHNPHGC